MSEPLSPELSGLFEYRSPKGDRKKLEIINAAIECLAEDGYDKTSYERIAQKLGTRRAHIAYHFSNKKDIFIAAIRAILNTYQKISLEHIEGTLAGKPMIKRYVEAVFDWAESNPQQVSVMLLLYYLCTIDEEFLRLHEEIRTKGCQRMHFILSQEAGLRGLGEKEQRKRGLWLAKTLQNAISAGILDAVTTESRSIKQARNDTLKLVDELVRCR